MTIAEMQEFRQRWNAAIGLQNHERHYVYLYRYPVQNGNRGKIFYVGVGQGDRVFQHLDLIENEDMIESEKVRVIQKLNDLGIVPDIDFLRTGLSRIDALKIESAVIDAIGLDNLTNIQAGHNSGICPLTMSPYVTIPATIEHNILGVNINNTYREYFPDLVYNPDQENDWQTLYECSSFAWKIDVRRLNRDNIQYYMPLYRGIILEVYKLESYMTIQQAIDEGIATIRDGLVEVKGYRHRLLRDDTYAARSRLILNGRRADDSIRNQYRFKSVFCTENPIRYFHPEV